MINGLETFKSADETHMFRRFSVSEVISSLEQIKLVPPRGEAVESTEKGTQRGKSSENNDMLR